MPTLRASQLATASSTPTPPRAPEPKPLPQGESVTRALAVKVDDECIDRWREILYDDFFPGKRSEMTPEQLRRAVSTPSTVDYMASQVYARFPNIPRLERACLLAACPKWRWLYVFKDNSSPEAYHAPIDPEDIRAVKEFLGVKKQGAKWYQVVQHV
ncbi:hypothetical protein K466DRAFT_584548 [Polyporus arcularius HHB13444]|uniref:Uncharacterized protein n=1 Tax=Polyporus arcularius HHB13444 TaxID=1314778 RepID=A0A5C3PTQ4_9APHY|nr:hypothetical protein K466DRAFT_584548 [Polyporus arcularius HHB13444]